MKVSTKGRYALRLMIDLAEHKHEEYVALKDISVRQKISLKYLEQIVSILGKAGYLESSRGPQGGYRLAGSPKEYNVGDIIRITEGNFSPTACLGGKADKCNMRGACAAVGFWEGLQNVINEYIDSFCLEDLIDKGV